MHPSRNGYTAPAALLNDIAHSGEHVSMEVALLSEKVTVTDHFRVRRGLSFKTSLSGKIILVISFNYFNVNKN